MELRQQIDDFLKNLLVKSDRWGQSFSLIFLLEDV